jgi:hypothetical protein
VSNISPHFVLKQVAEAIPKGCHKNIIIVGSLAAGYVLLPSRFAQAVRTKDVDCVLSPRIEAVESERE